MNYYKITAKIGHQGVGRHTKISFYFYEKNMSDALTQIRTMPMVKKGNAFPTTNVKIVDEKEFIFGSVYNPFFKYINSEEITEVYPLANIVERFQTYLSSFNPKTSDGQKLIKYCDKYSNANDKEKLKIEQDYIAWATKLINLHNNNDQILF